MSLVDLREVFVVHPSEDGGVAALRGLTLAVDLAFRGRTTLQLLDELDALVCEVDGAVYPAKDARMSPENFRRFFPEWERFALHVDPRFSSSFWRRVHAR